MIIIARFSSVHLIFQACRKQKYRIFRYGGCIDRTRNERPTFSVRARVCACMREFICVNNPNKTYYTNPDVRLWVYVSARPARILHTHYVLIIKTHYQRFARSDVYTNGMNATPIGLIDHAFPWRRRWAGRERGYFIFHLSGFAGANR